MLKKETVVFAVYITAALATTVNAVVQVRKTFKDEARDNRLMMRTTKKEN